VAAFVIGSARRARARVRNHDAQHLAMPNSSGTRDSPGVVEEEGDLSAGMVIIDLVRRRARSMREAREKSNCLATDAAEDLRDEQEERVAFDVDAVVVAALDRCNMPSAGGIRRTSGGL
jgi:hypothetical protein